MRLDLQLLLDGCVQALAGLTAVRASGFAAGAPQPAAPPKEVFEPSSRRAPGSDWSLVAQTLDRSATGGEAIARLHAAATMEIEAAEYAYQRLIEECPGIYVREAVQRLRSARASMEGEAAPTADAAPAPKRDRAAA
jgi:hypothetical protein